MEFSEDTVWHVPLFYDDDPASWVSWIDVFGSAHGYSDLNRLRFASGFLEGAALTWFNEANANYPFVRWVELKECLLQRFRRPRSRPRSTATVPETNQELFRLLRQLKQPKISQPSAARSFAITEQPEPEEIAIQDKIAPPPTKLEPEQTTPVIQIDDSEIYFPLVQKERSVHEENTSEQKQTEVKMVEDVGQVFDIILKQKNKKRKKQKWGLGRKRVKHKACGHISRGPTKRKEINLGVKHRVVKRLWNGECIRRRVKRKRAKLSRLKWLLQRMNRKKILSVTLWNGIKFTRAVPNKRTKRERLPALRKSTGEQPQKRKKHSQTSYKFSKIQKQRTKTNEAKALRRGNGLNLQSLHNCWVFNKRIYSHYATTTRKRKRKKELVLSYFPHLEDKVVFKRRSIAMREALHINNVQRNNSALKSIHTRTKKVLKVFLVHKKAVWVELDFRLWERICLLFPEKKTPIVSRMKVAGLFLEGRKNQVSKMTKGLNKEVKVTKISLLNRKRAKFKKRCWEMKACEVKKEGQGRVLHKALRPMALVKTKSENGIKVRGCQVIADLLPSRKQKKILLCHFVGVCAGDIQPFDPGGLCCVGSQVHAQFDNCILGDTKLMVLYQRGLPSQNLSPSWNSYKKGDWILKRLSTWEVQLEMTTMKGQYLVLSNCNPRLEDGKGFADIITDFRHIENRFQVCIIRVGNTLIKARMPLTTEEYYENHSVEPLFHGIFHVKMPPNLFISPFGVLRTDWCIVQMEQKNKNKKRKRLKHEKINHKSMTLANALMGCKLKDESRFVTKIKSLS